MIRDATGTAAGSVAAVSGTARYKDVLGAPDVTPLLLASMLARLPFGIFALASVLYLSHERDSYAVAGLVDGAFGIGAALGVPVQSRWMDRFGQRRILLPLAVLDATFTGLLIALTEGGAPTAALVACGLAGGFCIPNIGSALRGMDLDVDEHEVVCLIGASGSGKSTLLRCVNLLETVDDGTILLDGEEITRRGVNAERGPAADRDRVPGVQPVPAHDRAAQRHAGAARGAQGAPGRSGGAGDRAAGRFGLAEKARRVPGPALGRTAAAGRDRARAGDRPG